MRVFAVVLLIVLVLEALLGLAFYLGWHWWHGVLPALAASLVLAVLIVLPWLGSLQAEFDSDGNRLAGHLSWWLSFRLCLRPFSGRLRVLGLPFRLRPPQAERAEPKPKCVEKPKRRRGRLDIRALVRAIFAGLDAAYDLLWEADEVFLRVEGPVNVPLADAALASVVGTRHWGPCTVVLVAVGPRRVLARYRIGVLRATLILALAALQGQPWEIRPKRRRR
ncbi:MAG TPA: hypothetical protein VGM19_10925 [Armatimonadota bacterium]|jgi:hypothetical protein